MAGSLVSFAITSTKSQSTTTTWPRDATSPAWKSVMLRQSSKPGTLSVLQIPRTNPSSILAKNLGTRRSRSRTTATKFEWSVQNAENCAPIWTSISGTSICQRYGENRDSWIFWKLVFSGKLRDLWKRDGLLLFERAQEDPASGQGCPDKTVSNLLFRMSENSKSFPISARPRRRAGRGHVQKIRGCQVRNESNSMW